MRSIYPLVASLVAGGISVLAFAPFNIWFISFFSLAWLFYVWRQQDTKWSFYHGLAFGTGLFLLGSSWVYNSLSVYGGMPLWMGSIAVLGFSLLMGLFTALCGLVVAWLRPQGDQSRLLFMPFVWIVFEWCKSWVLTGFPWLDLGYSQIDTQLFHLAPIGGVYLVSFAVSTIAALLVFGASTLRVRNYRLVGVSLVALFAVIVGSSLFGQIEWGQPSGKALNVGIVQPNTPIENKWGLEYREQVLARLSLGNQQITDQLHPDLIVWPETALPALVSQTSDEFWQRVRPAGTALLTGIVDRDTTMGQIDDYNAAIVVCDTGHNVYRKRHLVPFGEYLPMRFLFQWVLDYLELPMSDFASWKDVQSLECGPDLKLGLSICYEDAFADEHREHTQGATLLVNISEDAWFGDSLAPHQRLQMAQMRAKELALPLVRSANSGPSVFIDERGKVTSQTAQFESATLTSSVQPRTGGTPFRWLGSWIVYLALLLMLVQGLLRIRAKST